MTVGSAKSFRASATTAVVWVLVSVTLTRLSEVIRTGSCERGELVVEVGFFLNYFMRINVVLVFLTLD